MRAAIAGDPRMNPPSGDEAGALRESREEALTEAAEIYELYTIALYGLDGRLVQGTSGAPDRLEDGFFSLLFQDSAIEAPPHLPTVGVRFFPGHVLLAPYSIFLAGI